MSMPPKPIELKVKAERCNVDLNQEGEGRGAVYGSVEGVEAGAWLLI